MPFLSISFRAFSSFKSFCIKSDEVRETGSIVTFGLSGGVEGPSGTSSITGKVDSLLSARLA